MKLHFITSFIVILFACQRKSPPASNGASSVDAPVSGTVSAPSGEHRVGSVPVCIQQKIDSLKQLPPSNPPAQVDEYDYKGEKVYGFSFGCCDMFYSIYNADCNYICASSGGITGKGDGKCKGFDTEAKMIRIVWKDERVRKPNQQ